MTTPSTSRGMVLPRRSTRVVQVGDVGIGGDNPLRIQSMTTTDTMDTEGTVAQALRLARAGCEIVRITAPSVHEARNLAEIRRRVRADGCAVPLVADIHFTPRAALEAVEHVEKVRINPGNFADKKAFRVREYTDDQYREELERIEQRFRPLVLRCKERGVPIRIGTNHGSLSDRIMNRYGDTPEGMVESALEFVRIAEAHGHRDLVLSMKASNVCVMIRAYRLLALRMEEEGMDYPFHLGVTEAGYGLEGRVKSALGIGSLLADGIGDTLRVSLTEDPVAEVPAARAIAERFGPARGPSPGRPGWSLRDRAGPDHLGMRPEVWVSEPVRRARVQGDGSASDWGRDRPVRAGLALDLSVPTWPARLRELRRLLPGPGISSGGGGLEWVLVRVPPGAPRDDLHGIREALPGVVLALEPLGDAGSLTPHLDLFDRLWGGPEELPPLLSAARGGGLPVTFVAGAGGPDPGRSAARLRDRLDPGRGDAIGVTLDPGSSDDLGGLRSLARAFEEEGAPPVLVWFYRHRGAGEPWAGAAVTAGALLEEGWGDVLGIETGLAADRELRLAYALLQGARLRITRTEYISCPSCGRTQFELEETTRRIKDATDHLPGLKIAVMGCIVNGPGEMADADFGYVGSGSGRIDLYVGRRRVVKGVPAPMAVERLVDLIREQGRWIDPPRGD
jgi:(E)-4-hydroxy-3-methylbut-2-enyl-diphosphate synthase